MSIDGDEPRPTLQVVAAVIRDRGVDPTWLLTGAYNPATHRRALEIDSEGTRLDLDQLIAEQLARETPADSQPMLRRDQ